MQGQLTIRDLISEIEKRQLILPEFQREGEKLFFNLCGYVWKQNQVLGYADGRRQQQTPRFGG